MGYPENQACFGFFYQGKQFWLVKYLMSNVMCINNDTIKTKFELSLSKQVWNKFSLNEFELKLKSLIFSNLNFRSVSLSRL